MLNHPAPFVSPLEPFESPKELVSGAKERLAELEAFAEAISKSCDCEIITHTDPKTREQVVKLRLKRRFPPKIRSLASSILKEMRIALDQAFCEAAVMLGRKNARGIYFPFGKSIDELNRQVKRKCENVDQALIDFCLMFKPHYGEDSDGFLWSLSSLAGSTHQTSIGAGFQGTTSFGEAILQAKGPLQLIINKWNNLHNELEVARLPSGAELHVKKDFTLRLQIVFAGSCHALSYRPLVETLHELGRIVEGIVLSIEVETARLLRERSV
jgi:hypothetical protein